MGRGTWGQPLTGESACVESFILRKSEFSPVSYCPLKIYLSCQWLRIPCQFFSLEFGYLLVTYL